MNNENNKDSSNPLNCITLEMMINYLYEIYGWDGLGRRINIKCFNIDPSIKSSLTFLRKTPWARKKVEELYLKTVIKKKRRTNNTAS